MHRISRRLFIRNTSLAGAAMTPGMVYFEYLMERLHGSRRRYFDMKPRMQGLSFVEFAEAIGYELQPHQTALLRLEITDQVLWDKIKRGQIRGFSFTSGRPFVLPPGVKLIVHEIIGNNE